MRFAAIGLDHRHIFHMVGGLIEAGADCAGFDPTTSDERVLAGFRERFPALVAREREALLDDPTIDLIVCAAVPCDRAGIAIAAMQAGKDVMVDKPGVTSFDQLAAVEAAVAETGRIFSICFSERFTVPATLIAGKLIADGTIGRVIQTVGLGPHRFNRAIRPDWFFDKATYGGILTDIASHQIDQFLHFTGSTEAQIVTSAVGHFADNDLPDFEDFGEVLLRSDRAGGYIRVDWFTADGLPTWGDGRLTILGTKGTIELRKYVDIAGRPGTDHVFLVDRHGTRHIDASTEPLTYFRNLVADIGSRGESAMRQSHVFAVCRLALEAQARAAWVPQKSLGSPQA
ncbi:Gfo/Idh/MocA family protein [Bosea sp. PAMC 26642]|uniref:Gfo/Idh/MocA family protein n=1 Tax=Bosea sp. (strain PAMC 26642) TaxID=1792307 RepID=UPI00077058D3|nr:Gfo/Idh/MocA family oxidoreductase [Bosea sp. PAMC 26642]AMJ62215.1 oxidoreductase [Bosea sp. PAMC 26642]